MYLNVCTLCCCSTCSVSLTRAKHQVCPVVHTIFIIIGKCLCTITPSVSCVAFNGAVAASAAVAADATHIFLLMMLRSPKQALYQFL